MNFDDYETLPTSNVGTHMTAGAIAGIMEHCVMYPLDSVKTRMQSLAPSNVGGSIRGTLTRMIKNEGLLRPVRGMSAMVLGAGPSHALYFSSYEYIKDGLIHKTTTSTYHSIIHGMAGCIATLLHDGIMTPAEVVKQRMQMLHSPYKSVLNCVLQVYRNEGLMAFYRSYTTQLTMNIPFQSIHFMIYEYAQKVTNRDRTYNPSAHVLSGALAGAIASAITTPLDVCKTLLNTQQVGNTTGMLEAIRKVYRIGGPAAYFRGMQARVMYQMPSTAICWSTYEFFKYVLGVTTKVEEVRLTLPPEATTAPKSDQLIGACEKLPIKVRELPAMAGTGLYSSLTFNTMHTQDSGFGRRKESRILDMTHT